MTAADTPPAIGQPAATPEELRVRGNISPLDCEHEEELTPKPDLLVFMLWPLAAPYCFRNRGTIQTLGKDRAEHKG